ncbi:MAG: tyrosine-type recombinase/integrase [Candidatus Thiodiazotropha lotti]|uniref:Tyrosine-type recombinase/integrase n=1 Tax=Candidatus Thiodiazotropha lotti TaxID=2792787 RepID=A0A9E4K2E6_9GAMM|nr:tyrosine-type recombinase/integrase [Candidatus Thiodiazotropha lotti]MCG7937499.1 tyrosine-type recombinase/integrase [Candidatus Thiodiazotropha lotti]MCW4201965.1 tyrosine-type recombinase/integrase [Candidatus Thiodiazotropha lotti]MCW4222796.1 tyrosine-type recombinase/integrase [Candidatus Thiodiazotropha lotti]
MEIPLAQLPTATAWARLSPHWPIPADRDLPGQWDAKVRFFQYLAKAWGAISDDSYRALCGDLRLFFDWCRARDLPVLPATPETISAFLVDQAEIKAKSTVRRYLATIAKAHKIAGLENPVLHEDVTLSFERLYRDDTSEPDQSEGLRWEQLKVALSNLGEGPRSVRDNALMRVMYDCLLRASEVRRLTLEGLSQDKNGYRLRVVRAKKRSKAQQGVIKYKYVHETTAAAIEAWCELAGITAGSLFRGVANSGQVLEEPLSTKGVNRAVQRIAKAADMDPRDYSGHACRIGACQDMLAAGIDIGRVMLAGDWERPEMPAYYGRRLSQDQSGIAELSRLQQR